MLPTTTIKKWWHAKSEIFSLLCDETFTNGEVVKMHLFFIALVVACCLAGMLEGGAV